MSDVEFTARAHLVCSAGRAFEEVVDLERYPRWLGIVQRVRAAESQPGDAGPAWWVDIGARLGPLRRTKRLRMVRDIHEPPRRVRFARAEVDGRSHAPWVMDVVVAAVDSSLTEGVTVRMDLRYDGTKWVPLLDAVLASEVRRAAGRLAEQVA